MVDEKSGWGFSDEEQKRFMEEEITTENCGEKLRFVRDKSTMSRRQLAEILGVSEATIRRLETKTCTPTPKFMNKLRALCLIGRARFDAMSDAEKEKVSEILGASGGVVAGVGGAIAAVGASGAVAGFSAAGITSGLAAIGGGAMLTGIGVVAAIPVATALLGYGMVKAIKAICAANNLSSEEVDGRWEIRTSE